MKAIKIIGKIILSIASVLSFGLAYLGLSVIFEDIFYIYSSENVKSTAQTFSIIVIAVLILLVAILILSFASRQTFIRIICTILLILFTAVAMYSSFLSMVVYIVLGPNGCSYTEDIENYGKYDENFSVEHFPDEITEDMKVVDFSYYYKYADATQLDIYLEVRFENAEIMEKYLLEATKPFEEDGTLSYHNPYNPSYTDIVANKWSVYSSVDGAMINHVNFGGEDNYKYVEMNYTAITYSYEELTIIFSETQLGSDISVGDDYDNAEYYPKLLKRFEIEWNPENDFIYKYVEDEAV